jgi:hypothetical protein
MNATPTLLKAIAVTTELTNTELSPAAARVMAEELAAYPELQVKAALKRCCRELRGRLTLAEVLLRIEDGRPTPEEAWALVPKDEAASAVMTAEMADAFRTAYAMVAAGELIPARMAFLERYRALVQQARDARRPVEWMFTPGTDASGKELVLLDAVEKGRISAEAAQALLPYHREDEGLSARLLSAAGRSVPQLPAPAEQPGAWKRLGQTLKGKSA